MSYKDKDIKQTHVYLTNTEFERLAKEAKERGLIHPLKKTGSITALMKALSNSKYFTIYN
jgi:hypothetical protein